MTDDARHVAWKRRQLRQTLIATGVVGAVIGLVPLLVGVLLAPTRIFAGDQIRPVSLQLMDGALFLLASIVFCVVVFGLLPMVLHIAFIRCTRWWTGRD